MDDKSLSYTSIVSFRRDISIKFQKIERRPRFWPRIVKGGSVLNYGSGKKDSESCREIISVYGNVKTCDNDPDAKPDYPGIEAIKDQTFDLIIAEHLIEHIEVGYFIDVVSQKLSELVKDSGKLLITIPNTSCYGSIFSHYDHKNFSPPSDIACILSARNFNLIDCCLWSKQSHMIRQRNFTEMEKMLEKFMNENYGLQTDRYITMVFDKNGKV